MAELNKEEFVANAVRLIDDRPQSNVLVIVESPAGLELMPSVTSAVWLIGIVEAVSKLVDERFRQGLMLPADLKQQADLNAKYGTFSVDEKGKVN